MKSCNYVEKSDTMVNPPSGTVVDIARPGVISQECIGVGIQHNAPFGKDNKFSGSMTKVNFPGSPLSVRDSGDPQCNSSCKADMKCNENEVQCKELYCAAAMTEECTGIRNPENLPYGGDDLRSNSSFKEEIATSSAVVERKNEYSLNQHFCTTSAGRHEWQLIKPIPERDDTSTCSCHNLPKSKECKIQHRRVHSEPKSGTCSLNIHFTTVTVLPSVGILIGKTLTDRDTQESNADGGLPNAVTMNEKADVLFEMATSRERSILSEESKYDLKKESLIEENVITGALKKTQECASLKHQHTSTSSSVHTDKNESQLSHRIPKGDDSVFSCQQTANDNLDGDVMLLLMGNGFIPSTGILMNQASTYVSRNASVRCKPLQFIPRATCTSTLQQFPGFLSDSLDTQNTMLKHKMCLLESAGILMSGSSIHDNLCEQQPFTITTSEQDVGNSVTQANFEVNEVTTTCQKNACEANACKVTSTSTESLTSTFPDAFCSFQHRCFPSDSVCKPTESNESYFSNDCTSVHFFNTEVRNSRSGCSTKLRRQHGDSQNYDTDIQKHSHLSVEDIMNSAGVLMVNPSARTQASSLSITNSLHQKRARHIPMNQTATEGRILQSTGILMTTNILSLGVGNELLTGTCMYY